MKISGIQKLTCLDFPGKVAATIFTPGCNFRCPFCHNASLAVPGHNIDSPVASEMLTPNDVLSFLETRMGLLDGIAITGGEPLIQSGIDDFICGVGKMGFAVKLDTNGSFPERLKSLLDRDLLDYVAMDIKNSPGKYMETTDIAPVAQDSILASVNESIRILKDYKASHDNFDYEFRTTCVKGLHTVEDFALIGQWLGEVPHYFLQNFVDSGDLINPDMQGHDEKTMHLFLDEVKKYIPHAELRGI